MVKNLPANAGDAGLIPGSGRSPEEGNGNPLQYSSMKNAKTKLVKSNKTTSKTISKLKSKKKYYVQVRTYKTVDGVKYYSKWSEKKAVTTK